MYFNLGFQNNTNWEVGWRTSQECSLFSEAGCAFRNVDTHIKDRQTEQKSKNG